MSDLLNVSASPHVRSKTRTNHIMADVAAALLPAAAFGIYNFGLSALLVIAVSITTCVLTEYAYERFMRLPITTGDFSALVTGLLLALNLPASVPLWLPVIGGVFAILIVKQLFGGLGQNFMNPALAARCFLLISFTKQMTDFSVPSLGKFDLQYGAMAVDGLSGATPLAVLKAGESVDVCRMFFGQIGGVIGETSVAALLIGAAYLLFKKIISWRIPAAYLAVFSFFILAFGGHGFDLTYLAAQICGGGLILGAFFMATDYVTSPITPNGKIVFGVLLGCLTGIFRIFGGSAEGVSYAIIFCNLLVPLIERVTIPKPFGYRKEAAANGK